MRKTFAAILFIVSSSAQLFAQNIDTPDTLWSFTIGRYPNTTPCLDNGIIYAAGEKGVLYAVDAKTGQQKWKQAMIGNDIGYGKKGIYHSIISDDKKLYLNNGSNTFFAVDKATGRQLWAYSSRFDDDYVTNIFQYQATVIFNSLDSSITALEKNGGNVKWSYKAKDVIGGIAMKDDQVYFYTRGGKAGAINASTGKESWTMNVAPFEREGLPPHIMSNYMVMTDRQGKAKCISITDKKIIWEKDLTSPFVYSGITGFISCTDSGIVHLDPKTGKESWRVPGRNAWYIEPFLLDGMIYYYSRIEGKLYCIDEKSGKVKYTFMLKGKTYTSPIADKERIYFGISDKYFAVKRPQ